MKYTIVILCMAYGSALGQEITFDREDITFALRGKTFSVDGYYWFINPSDSHSEAVMYYPFGADPETERIDTVVLRNVSQNSAPAILSRNQRGIQFLLRVEPGDTVVYNIGYTQSVASDSVVYILTTTQQWKRPLNLAEYRLMTGDDIALTGFSYEPDTLYNIGEQKIFYWKRERFSPKTDMVFHFRLK